MFSNHRIYGRKKKEKCWISSFTFIRKLRITYYFINLGISLFYNKWIYFSLCFILFCISHYAGWFANNFKVIEILFDCYFLFNISDPIRKIRSLWFLRRNFCFHFMYKSQKEKKSNAVLFIHLFILLCIYLSIFWQTQKSVYTGWISKLVWF